MILLALTTLIAGTFFGACLYVTFVEHPARIEIGTEGAIKQFRPSARRAAVMQGGLSAVGLLLGLITVLGGLAFGLMMFRLLVHAGV